MNLADTLWAGALARAVATAAAFAATVPLMPRSLEPRVVRVALMIALVPLLLHSSPAVFDRSPLIVDVAHAVMAAAALGIAASVVANAVTAAGATVDAALGAPPFAAAQITSGPVALAYQLLFACVLLQTGGLTAMLGAVVHLERLDPGLFTVRSCVALASIFTRESLVIAVAPLFSQALATLFAAVLARASPQLGGVLFASSISPAAVALAIILGSTTLAHEFVGLSHAQASLLRTLAK